MSSVAVEVRRYGAIGSPVAVLSQFCRCQALVRPILQLYSVRTIKMPLNQIVINQPNMQLWQRISS